MTVQKRDIDAVTGVETTGHEWDGIKELNKPLPRWWLLTFYATIVWAIGYWIVYPAWPTLNGYTRGMLGYSQRATVADEVKAAQAAQGGLRDQLAAAIARADQARAGPAALCHGRRRRCVPGQLRAVPRPRRAGLRRLSQPQRRRLAVGRHDRGHPQDHQQRRPLGPEGRACLADAALWARQAAGGPADRRRRRVRAVACRANRATRQPWREARRSSPTSARAVTAPTARASRTRAPPT